SPRGSALYNRRATPVQPQPSKRSLRLLPSRDRIVNTASAGWQDIATALAFLTRLPLEGPGHPTLSSRPLAGAAWAFPLAGVLVGLAGGAAYVIASGAGLSPFLAAAIATGTTVAITGALHEDGL